jgi:hypothetical protein
MSTRDSARDVRASSVARGLRSRIDFSEYEGAHSGVGKANRMWRITRCYTGWHLEFRDPGDMTATYAGIHATLAAAKHEADS